jgi:DNA-binding transcriptional LysR family regulator
MTPLRGSILHAETHHARLIEEELDLAIRIAEAPEPSLVVRRIGVSKVLIVAAPYLRADSDQIVS